MIESNDWQAVWSCNFKACCANDEDQTPSRHPPQKQESYTHTTRTQTRVQKEYVNERYVEEVLNQKTATRTTVANYGYSNEQLIGPGYSNKKPQGVKKLDIIDDPFWNNPNVTNQQN